MEPLRGLDQGANDDLIATILSSRALTAVRDPFPSFDDRSLDLQIIFTTSGVWPNTSPIQSACVTAPSCV